jgi:hypothetical protein
VPKTTPSPELVGPAGTAPATLIVPEVVMILPPKVLTPWPEARELEAVPTSLMSPPMEVRLAPAVSRKIAEFAPAPIPFALKSIAMNPVDALVFEMVALRSMNESAVRVRVFAVAQVTGLLTVMDPEFGPAPAVPTVEIVTEHNPSCVLRSVLRI